MMSGWAWRHRRLRKQLAGLLVHPGAFAAAAGWHATSPEERDDIVALGFRQPVCVSPNGVPLPAEAELVAARTEWQQLCPAAKSRPVALFYSRLHRKKRVRELETEIEKFEREIEKIDRKLADGALHTENPAQAATLGKTRNDAALTLAQLEEEWLAASARGEELRAAE